MSPGQVNKTTTDNDHTPLSLACAGGHVKIVDLLLTYGADPAHVLKVRPTTWNYDRNLFNTDQGPIMPRF